MKKIIFLLAAVCITTITMAQSNNKTAHPKGNINTNGGGEVIGDILDGVGIKTKDPKDKPKVVNKVKANRANARRKRPH
jgi:hypothetical protein